MPSGAAAVRWSTMRHSRRFTTATRHSRRASVKSWCSVVSGLLNKQVAGELGISEITVKAHRGQVMRKMKADSLPALVNMVAWLGLPTGLPAYLT